MDNDSVKLYKSKDTCKALVFKGVKAIEYQDIPIPVVQEPHEAVLKVIACGICGSDLHPFHGREGCAIGTAFGHECVGEVVAKGSETGDIQIGQVYVVPFTTACGDCFHCNNCLSARCSTSKLFGWKDENTNIGLNGAQSEYVLVPDAKGSLYPLSPLLSVEEGVLIADIACTAAYAVGNAGIAGWQDCVDGNSVSAMMSLLSDYDIDAGFFNDESREDNKACRNLPLNVYVVIGCGPVGLMTVAMACIVLKYRGYSSSQICIIAVDTVPHRLQAAQQWGAIPFHLHLDDYHTTKTTNNVNRDTKIDQADTTAGSMEHHGTRHQLCDFVKLKSRRNGRSGSGADAVIECVGAYSALDTAYDLVAAGGTISSIGVHHGDFPFSPSQAYDKNVTYRSGRCPARSMMPIAEKLLLLGRRGLFRGGAQKENIINLGEIITHRFRLCDGKQAYEVFDKKLDNCLKPVMYPAEYAELVV